MILKCYFFATTISLLQWVAVYFAAVASCNFAQYASVIPRRAIQAAFVTLVG